LPMSSNIRPLTVPLVQPLIRAPPSTCPHTLPILGTTSSKYESIVSAGRSRPPRGLKRSRQDRMSKDASKLLLLYDENILEKDPQRESKDTAFAQGYLNRVYEALQDTPMKMEQFVTLLGEFEKVGEMPDVVSLFHRLQCILGHRTDLLRDFAAFLQPEQALECGLNPLG
uniref:Uncharacterized protein n=1 Tax=Periophthalmus magnuspinnatus TaxID=409849 RepID=A0A3B4A0V3_9GOBI